MDCLKQFLFSVKTLIICLGDPDLVVNSLMERRDREVITDAVSHWRAILANLDGNDQSVLFRKIPTLAIFKVSERFEKPYDSRICVFRSVQCCSMAFTAILVAIKVSVPLYKAIGISAAQPQVFYTSV